MTPEEMSDRLLDLIIRAELLAQGRMGDLLDECTQLGKMIAQSIVTAKAKGSQRKQRSRDE